MQTTIAISKELHDVLREVKTAWRLRSYDETLRQLLFRYHLLDKLLDEEFEISGLKTELVKKLLERLEKYEHEKPTRNIQVAHLKCQRCGREWTYRSRKNIQSRYVTCPSCFTSVRVGNE